jgi:hypothetical protein
MRNTRSRFTRVGIAAVALAPALAFAPAAVADDAESDAPAASESSSSEGSEGSSSSDDSESDAPSDSEDTPDTPADDEDAESDGSSSEDVSIDDVASSLAETDWERVAGVLANLSAGNVSLSTVLDIIDLANGGDQTVGDVISSAADSLGVEAGSADVFGSAVSDVTGGGGSVSGS